MDWSNEPYVKVYTRDTDDDLALTWEARAVWGELMRKFDRSGLIETKRGARGLAALIRFPFEVVERALPELLEDGRLVQVASGYMAPNFIAAQEAKKSDKLRQKEVRDRRRHESLSETIRNDANIGVTKRDGGVTKRDETVAPSHTASHGVTPRHTESLSALHCIALQSAAPARAHAIPPTPEHGVPEHAEASREITPSGADRERTQQQNARALAQASADLGKQRGEYAEQLWQRISDERMRIARKHRLDVLPLPPVSASEPVGFRELRTRLREEGPAYRTAAEHVFTVLVNDADKARSVEWLSDKAFSEGAWRTARNRGAAAKRVVLTHGATEYDLDDEDEVAS